MDGNKFLKKYKKSDPGGAYKLLGNLIKSGFILSGIIFSPKTRTGGAAERLAIENSDFIGYGFGVDLSTKKIWIEFRRDNGKKKDEYNHKEIEVPSDRYYKYEFFSKGRY